MQNLPKLIIFDMDGVLVKFYPMRRLEYLSKITNFSQKHINTTIFQSDFEDQAEAGQYANGTEYLKAFNQKLAAQISLEQWNTARQYAIEEDPNVLDYVKNLQKLTQVVMLTNNGPLLIEQLHQLAPKVATIFSTKAHATCQFNARKPNVEVYENIAQFYALSTQDCLMIDDKTSNIQGAIKSGMAGHHFTKLKNLENYINIQYGLAKSELN